MDWLRSHPYAFALLGAAVFVIAGIFVVENRKATVPDSGISAWSGGTADLSNSNQTPATVPSSPANLPQPAAVTSTTTLPYTIPKQTIDTGINTNDSFDFNAFIAGLSGPSTKNNSTKSSTSGTGVNAYDFIPSNLISTSSATQKKYDDVQQSLYDYGNAAGEFIQSYEARDRNQVQVLKNALEDRSDSVKSAAVAQIGADLQYVGQKLAGLPDVPAQASSANAAVAQSYQDVGKKLIDVSAAGTLHDSDFIAAIQAYNATADTFTKHYVTLALTFSSYGVTFPPNEPGSVFSFSPGASF